jgi:hypothetical protein
MKCDPPLVWEKLRPAAAAAAADRQLLERLHLQHVT